MPEVTNRLIIRRMVHQDHGESAFVRHVVMCLFTYNNQTVMKTGWGDSPEQAVDRVSLRVAEFCNLRAQDALALLRPVALSPYLARVELTDAGDVEES